MDTVELTGVPGLRAMVVDNTTDGLFQFFGKFSKDIGLIDVLKNTSTMFPLSSYDYSKAIAEAAKDTMPTMPLPETEHPDYEKAQEAVDQVFQSANKATNGTLFNNTLYPVEDY